MNWLFEKDNLTEFINLPGIVSPEEEKTSIDLRMNGLIK
jgi:hypothetical protein